MVLPRKPVETRLAKKKGIQEKRNYIYIYIYIRKMKCSVLQEKKERGKKRG